MLIQQNTYPEFVADQILSSDHLNRLFGYLDEEERLTRVNLLGIGVVCGLDVKLNSAGSELTITKGSGVTSKGYLVSNADKVYAGYKEYDMDREKKYDQFTNLRSLNPTFKPLELIEKNSPGGSGTPLTTTFLQDYTVMIYVELLEQSRNNCEDNTCDYDGIMIKATMKPLLIPNSFASVFISGAADVGSNIAALPEIALNRFDVTATAIQGSGAIIEGYRNILAGQVQKLGDALNAVFLSLYPFVSDEYTINPFPGLISSLFYFLNNGSYPVNSMLHVQYYYDLLADIYNVYDEIRENGDRLVGMCNPDASLFPQHLMLGPAVNRSVDGSRVQYRHYFMPSGAVKSCSSGIGDLRLQFKRLVLLLQRFVLPQILSEQVGSNAPRGSVPVRITPDVIGDVSLADKSIPFYYDATAGDDKLYRYWNYSKTYAGQADRNLSYNADTYRTGPADDPILKPLYYDLEDYNFFRVEGHIGMAYRTAVNTILTIRNQHRLPFEVVAIRSSQSTESLIKKLCCGDGLELNYDIVRREWEAVVGETIAFINANREMTDNFLGSDTTAFINKLQNVKNYLVDEMSGFMPKYNLFMQAFEDIEQDCADYRDTVYQQMGEAGSSTFVFGEDLVDHLDALGHSAKKGAFRAVYQAWKGLGASIEETLTLAEYLKAHPGINHKAGVPAGGTLVLVYHTADTKEEEQQDVDIMLARVPEGTVIADFYLPYLCCSDCSPVQVVIGNGQPEVKPTISAPITTVCKDDPKIDKQYPVTVLPSTSTVVATINGTTVPDVVSNNSGSWVFDASKVTVPDDKTNVVVTLTATNGTLSSSWQITVYAAPVIVYNIAATSNPLVKRFTVYQDLVNDPGKSSKHVDKITWDFRGTGNPSDQVTASYLNPQLYTYPSDPRTYNVKVSASNGSCTYNAPTQQVTIVATEPCGGKRHTCQFVWPFTRETNIKTVKQEIKVDSFLINGVNQGGTALAPVTISMQTQTFANAWSAIASQLNSLYGSTHVVFNTPPGAYASTGYLVPVTSYDCPEYKFEISFTITTTIDSQQPSTVYYRYSSARGTERLYSSQGDTLQTVYPLSCDSSNAASSAQA